MGNNFEVKMNEYLPLRDVVFNTLRQAILKGELAPGERLMEIQLAQKLGVSRTPIREAIRKLELEGLVLMIPRRGAEVARISEKSLKDVLEVRRSLEELAIELACQRMTEEDMQALEEAQKAFKAAIDQGDAMKIAETDEWTSPDPPSWQAPFQSSASAPAFLPVSHPKARLPQIQA